MSPWGTAFTHLAVRGEHGVPRARRTGLGIGAFVEQGGIALGRGAVRDARFVQHGEDALPFGGVARARRRGARDGRADVRCGRPMPVVRGRSDTERCTGRTYAERWHRIMDRVHQRGALGMATV